MRIVKNLREGIGGIVMLLLMALSGQTYGQDVDFSEVENKVGEFINSALDVINIIGGLFCLIFIIRIAMSYWGGGEEGRQDAGGMIKKLVIGVIVWLVMYQVVNGIFGTDFGN